MQANELSRRDFLLRTTSALLAGRALVPSSRQARAAETPAASLPQWPEEVYRRFSVDIHIPDWDPALLSKFNAAEYVGHIARGGAQSLVHYANSHVGLCLWNTRVGQRHASLMGRDLFGEVVAECRKRGIHPLAYFSVIHDNWAFENHPEWRFINADGGIPTGRYGFVCPNSPYRDYVVACVKEIAGNYEISGMFFDMMFWPGLCYCPHCQARFQREEGSEIPRIVDWEEPLWRRFQQARQNWLIEFAQACTTTAKQARPAITVSHQFSTILHNWAVGVPLRLAEVCDFVGGDFYGGPTQHSLACKLYYGLTRTRPFEFHTSRTRIYTDHVTVKPPEELRVEAGVAILHSAALMLVDYINPDGTLNPGVYEMLAELSQERARYEPHLGGELQADVAVYFDKESLYNPDEQKVEVNKRKATDKCPHRDAVVGWARILQEAHIPFGVITEAALDQLSRYRALVLPHVLEMTERQAEQFKEFVAAGGVLYASGASSRQLLRGRPRRFLLEEVLGVRYLGGLGSTATYLTPQDPELASAIWPQDHLSFDGAMIRAEPLRGAEVLARATLPFVDPALGKNLGSRFAAIHSNPPALQPGPDPCVVRHRFGKGEALWTAAPFEIRDEHSNRALVLNLLRRILPGPFAFEVEAHSSVEITSFHQPEQRRFRVGLLNLQQEFPQIPAPATVRVRIPSGKRAESVTRVPEGDTIPFRRTGDYAEFEVKPFTGLAMFFVRYS